MVSYKTMNCKEFQNWLSTRDVFDDEANPDIHEHLTWCDNCKILFSIDLNLETSIQSAFHLQDIPAGFYKKMDCNLNKILSQSLNEPLDIDEQSSVKPVYRIYPKSET
jgi:hypothetical protein